MDFQVSQVVVSITNYFIKGLIPCLRLHRDYAYSLMSKGFSLCAGKQRKRLKPQQKLCCCCCVRVLRHTNS